jgi:heptaprenyl diphosphate synthase
MKPSRSLFDFTHTTRTGSVVHLAFFTALAVSMYLLEMLIPRPLPFMKLGLANIVVLMLLLQRQITAGAVVAVAKTLVGGFFSGTLLSPTTVLSLGGTLVAFCLMLLALYLPVGLGVMGISILGAVGHNLGQLCVVRLLLMQQNGIFHLTPLLIVMGMVTGMITGAIAWKVLQATKGDYEKTDR